jgi:hypothetical protein
MRASTETGVAPSKQRTGVAAKQARKTAQSRSSRKNDPDQPVLREMSTLGRQRVELPEPDVSFAFALSPDRLPVERVAELNALYERSRPFRAIVDELRANKVHYLNQANAHSYED